MPVAGGVEMRALRAVQDESCKTSITTVIPAWDQPGSSSCAQAEQPSDKNEIGRVGASAALQGEAKKGKQRAPGSHQGYLAISASA